MGSIDGIAAAAMSMSAMQLETACNTALLKESMESMEQQALSLISDLAQTVPAPAVCRGGHIDTYI